MELRTLHRNMRLFSTLSRSFTVRRQSPVLVPTARATPRETNPLSDVDDQQGLCSHISHLHFYKGRNWRNNNEFMRKSGDDDPVKVIKDPVKVIKAALAKTLEPYYPFAGRLKEVQGKKLAVECTGEGVLFVEADADFTLEDFGEGIHPPFPGWQELVFNVPGSNAILHSPLLLIQVTRLQCGGFIFPIRFNHIMADGIGLAHFKIALAEIARGSSAPSVPPVWMRELLIAQDPPRITSSVRHENDVLQSIIRTQLSPEEDFVHKSFFFGKSEIAALRDSLRPHLRSKCSNFVLLTACHWRCRILALQPDPEEDVSVCYTVNARSRLDPPLPLGYYGNAFAISGAQTKAGELMKNPFEYAVELVMKSTARIKEKRFKSATDILSPHGKVPIISLASAYMVSDLTRLGFDEVDFGWGKPVYAGPAAEPIPGVSTFHISATNKQGDRGIVVPMSLPGFVMERLTQEINQMVMSVKED
ncbi:OLC1v1012269C1 [Oldenlandia corymbosa var. corymbosa]|uniref:OLC1v1012269C1 n=1 Tax=Oldenlandia corymbosa var. corymbosa TaxID=529605 RepID=A0AAV1DYL7_OLDCO|nr:OLC1v1012269C1 [Oldenlandia corymbosa var. corymbosa]